MAQPKTTKNAYSARRRTRPVRSRCLQLVPPRPDGVERRGWCGVRVSVAGVTAWGTLAGVTRTGTVVGDLGRHLFRVDAGQWQSRRPLAGALRWRARSPIGPRPN